MISTISTETAYQKYVVVAIVSWMIVFSIACNEIIRSNYATFVEAVDAGETIRGWIPDYLPESSRNIHLIHGISPSITWCTFEFSPDDVQVFKEVLKTKIDFLPARLQQIKRPDSLWPEFLSGNLDIDKIHENGFSSYVLERKCYQGLDHTALLFFVIDWKNGKGFFHNTICQKNNI